MSERIRIVRIIARLNVGGPALHAVRLTEKLDSSRYESLLVTGVEERSEANFLVLHGQSLKELVVLPSLGRTIRPGHDVRTLVQLVRVLRRRRPHIVHTHTAKAGTLGRLAARLARVPVVVHTYHGHVFQGYFSAAQTRLFLAIERWLATRTTCLVAVSESVRAELLSFGIGTPEQVTVIPLGLELDRFLNCQRLRGELRRELAIASDAPLVGIVARLVPIKAHELFLQAAALVTRTREDCRFLVVGDGQRRTELERMAADLGLGDCLRFVGWRHDLQRIYADLDVAVLCSRNEGSPVSLIEAMAAGCPVVATRVGGVPDLVEDGVNGYLVEAGDGPGLGRAILKVLSDPDRARGLGSAGRKRVYPQFSEGRLLADIDQLYERLLR